MSNRRKYGVLIVMHRCSRIRSCCCCCCLLLLKIFIQKPNFLPSLPILYQPQRKLNFLHNLRGLTLFCRVRALLIFASQNRNYKRHPIMEGRCSFMQLVFHCWKQSNNSKGKNCQVIFWHNRVSTFRGITWSKLITIQ